jgi:pyruvate carboxylase subunit B
VKYFVAAAGRTVEVTVDGARILLDGQEVEAHLTLIPGTPLRHLLLGHESFTLAVEPGERGVWRLGFQGSSHRFEVVDERTRHIRSLTAQEGNKASGGELRAPMPGLVLRIQVEPGQVVAAGQPVVALEAMKMENELRATEAGRVRAIAVEPGQAVEKGAILVQFDPLGT